MNVFARVEARIAAAIEALQKSGALPADLPVAALEVEFPRDPTHGDLSANAALVLAKAARMKPRDIAEQLKGEARRRSRYCFSRGRRAGLPQPHDEACLLAEPRQHDP